MNRLEAMAWIRGDRSLTNMIPQNPLETWDERIARADAAMVERAYWVLRAHQDLDVFKQEITKENK